MYASQDDLVRRFSQAELDQRADPEETGAADPAVVTRSLGDASELIDGYLGTRYRLPLAAPVPALVVRLCCDIARYLLWADRTSERVRAGYHDAIEQLKAISKGVIRLEAAGIEPEPSPDSDHVVSFDPGAGSVLTRARLRNW